MTKYLEKNEKKHPFNQMKNAIYLRNEDLSKVAPSVMFSHRTEKLENQEESNSINSFEI